MQREQEVESATDLDERLARAASSSRARFRAFQRVARQRRLQAKTAVETAPPDDGRLRQPQNGHEGRRPQKDAGTRRRYLRRYVGWLAPHRWQLICLIVAGTIVGGLEMAIPYLVGQMVDAVGGQSRLLGALPHLAQLSLLQLLLCLAASGMVIILLARALNLWRNLAVQKLNAQVTHRLRAELHARLLRLPMGDLHDLKSGGIVSRLSSDVDGTIGLVQEAVLSPVQAMLRLLLVSAYLFWLSWQVTLVSVTMLILVGGIYHVLLGRVRPIYRSMSEDRQRVDGRVAETFGGLRVVRSFARENAESLAYGVGHHTIIRKQLWARGLQSLLLLFWETLMPVTSLVIVAMGCYLVLSDAEGFTIGDIFQFQMLTFMVLNPVFTLVQSMTDTQKGLASMERVYEILERPLDKPDRPDARSVPASVEELHFDAVSFAYRDDPAGIADEDWVIRDFSLRLPGGSVTALVGASGAGKSTLADLLARFHDPQRGALRLNGIDIQELKLAEYRQLFGIVQQETFLFDGSISDNIRYGRRSASEAEVRAAARQANALTFIEELPYGFDSIIGERGVKLSGGQRQRLSIARAILADPAILILDEATSNLDSESEQLIQEALRDLFKDRTTLVIAHRLSTIRDADQIVVLEKGRIVQCGQHHALLAAGPDCPYAQMVARQSVGG